MHMYFFVRGKFEQVEQWKAHAQASYWKFRVLNNKTGKIEVKLVQGALRPSIFGAYEFVFPKEALAEVCNFFGVSMFESADYGFGSFSLYTRKFCLRKIFNCKKIPKAILKKADKIQPTFSTIEFERGCSKCVIPGVSFHLIGIKEDVVAEAGGYIYERL